MASTRRLAAILAADLSAELANVVDVMRCAVEVQRGMIEPRAGGT
jgi:hypothetical protein